MTETSARATAPGKAILFGEHAVVYGQPAIAVPVTQVRATATIEPALPGQGLTLGARESTLCVRRVLPHIGMDVKSPSFLGRYGQVSPIY